MSILTRKFNQIKKEENKVKSVDLVDWINEFRNKQGNNRKLLHKNFLAKIEKYNQEINELNIQPVKKSFYLDNKGEKRKCYLLSKHEALIFSASENNIIKAMVIQYMDNMEFEFNVISASIDHTKETHDKLYELVKEHKPDKVGVEYSRINRYINQSTCKILGFNQNDLSKEDMTLKQLETRANVEELWVKYYKGKKSGIKAIIESELMSND